MPTLALRALVVADQETYADLIVAELRRAGFDVRWTRVQAETEFLANVEAPLDIILSACVLAHFSALDALRLLKAGGLDIPLIVLTDVASEAIALESLQRGAVDYVFEDRLARLGPVVMRILQTQQHDAQEHHAQQAGVENDQRFRRLAENAVDVLFHIRVWPDVAIEYISPSCTALTGYTPAELYVHPQLLQERIHPDERDLEGRFIAATQRGAPLLFRWIRKDGAVIWLENKLQVITDINGSPVAIEGITRDLTDQHRAEQEQRRLNRALQTLGRCSEALVRASDETDLLQKMCQIIVDVGGYRMVWVGFPEPDENKTVRPVAKAGHEDGYLTQAKLTWADTEYGRGPGGVAIRSGQPILSKNIRSDVRFAPWREAALQRGYEAVFSLPLVIDNQAIGILSIYSDDADAFDAAEAELLVQLADDLAYGLAALRIRNEGRQAEEALRESETRLRAIVSNLPIILLTFDRQEIITFAEGRGLEPTRHKAADLVGQPISALLGRFAEFGTSHRRVFEGDSFDTVIELFPDAVFDIRFSPLRDWQGAITGCIAVAIDITERKQAEAAWQAAAQIHAELAQERQLRELKDQLISTASHEFRTPLTTILSSASLIEVAGDKMPAQKVQHHLRKIQSNVGNMINLLDDVLTVNKAEANRLEYRPVQLDLVAFCTETLSEIEAPSGAGHHFTFAVEGDAAPIEADEKLMRQIFANLLSNAVKYSPANSTIEIDLRFDPEEVTLTVKDAGIGIPAEDQPHIFEPFFRARNISRVSGTGLGLTIVEKAVARHGGTVTFESQLQGGTTFTVTLPREKVS